MQACSSEFFPTACCLRERAQRSSKCRIAKPRVDSVLERESESERERERERARERELTSEGR